MNHIQYKDTELNQLLTRKRKPHSYTKRSTQFPFMITKTDNRNIMIQILTAAKKQ